MAVGARDCLKDTVCCYDDNPEFSFFYDVYRGTVNTHTTTAPRGHHVKYALFGACAHHPRPPPEPGLLVRPLPPLVPYASFRFLSLSSCPSMLLACCLRAPPKPPYPQQPRAVAWPWHCEIVLHVTGNDLTMSVGVGGSPPERQKGCWPIPSPFRVFVCPTSPAATSSCP